MSSDSKTLKTVPADARFHQQNCTNWCYSTFVDYCKCNVLLGKGNKSCEEFGQIARTICPNAWIQRWEEQLSEGTFPVDMPDKCK